jgi:superfamily II DNA or RNA helicase/post-segregation antitoxin (ccd killing protein)
MNITLRNYQEEAIDFLNTNEGKLVLAMCPSSGKTETIIHYLNEQYNLNPNLKVLILPHSTNVLLDNFYQRLESRNVDFTYSSDVNDDVNVHVVLPQNHNKIVGHYDLIIIDEAHENYLAKTIQGIIKKTQAGKEILLTGTPSKFIGNNDFKLHFVALSDLCELYTPKLRIDIIESDYDWNGNYNTSKEIKSSYKFSKESTEISLKKTFDFLLKRNDSDSVEKTLIVCRNIAQSNYVKEYLTSIGFSSEISNSDNDKDSENVAKFKNNLIDILIVVNRARLGYDDADLINLIDISGTLNPNIIYQMFARLLRGTQDMKKYYIRLTSKNDDVYNSEIATSVALMLTHTNYIKVFNGKNVNSQEIIVNSEFFIKSKKSLDKSSGKSKTLGKRKLFIDVQEDDSFDIINFFKEVIEKKEKQVGLYKFCKVSDVLNELSSSLTKEECIENAKKYKTQKEWKIYDLRYYNRSYIKGWISECSAHFVNLRGISRTKEECIKDAKKYESSKNWRENSPVYGYAYKSKWMDECSAHFIKLNGISRTKEECIEDAKKYKTIKEWRENSGAIYGYAISKKWLQECSAHLINLNTSRTLEQCVENAKKYETKKEWYENSSIIYKYVVRKKWMAECSAHFINSINKKTRTKEECIDDAKKYKTQKEWIENSPTIYKYAYKNKWMDECSAQMTKLNGVSKTKEECIEDARNYKTKKEWRANSSAFYGYASNKKWMNECSAHFINLRDKKIRTLKECIDDARKYESSKSWKKNSPTIYGYAVHRKWLKEIKSLIFNQ